jgi:hypothetical protein
MWLSAKGMLGNSVVKTICIAHCSERVSIPYIVCMMVFLMVCLTMCMVRMFDCVLDGAFCALVLPGELGTYVRMLGVSDVRVVFAVLGEVGVRS